MAVSKLSTQLTQGNNVYYNRGAKTNEFPTRLTQKQSHDRWGNAHIRPSVLFSLTYFIIVMLLREAKSKFDSLDKSLIPNYDGRNKGKRGQELEQLLGKELCSGLLDFDDGEGKSFKSRQTIAVTQLLHVLDELINGVSFKQSKVFTKLSNCWFIRFTKDDKFDRDLIFNRYTHPLIFDQLSEDWDYISDCVRSAYNNGQQLRTFNGPRDKNGVHKLLQIRTKASPNKKTGKYTPLVYNGQQLKNKYMGFYLTTKFEKLLFD